MAQYRPKVPPSIKRALLQQAGDKCANPGCPNRLVEIHHIDQWAVYQTHNQESMIAICPSCHDAVTRGSLTINDEELYAWKGIKRTKELLTGQLYVEPASWPRFLLGSIEFIGADGITILDIGDTKLSLVVHEGELGWVNLKVVDAQGQSLIDIVDNYVRQRNPGIIINSRPGRYQVKVDDPRAMFPAWAVECISHAPSPANDPAHFDALDIQVVSPGIVKVKGVFLGDNGGLVVSDKQIYLLSRKLGICLGFAGPPTGTAKMIFMGSLNLSVFGQRLAADFW